MAVKKGDEVSAFMLGISPTELEENHIQDRYNLSYILKSVFRILHQSTKCHHSLWIAKIIEGFTILLALIKIEENLFLGATTRR